MEKTTNLLSLKSDWVFKRIFGKEGNEDILGDLLSAILDIEIKKIELKNTELLKNKEETTMTDKLEVHIIEMPKFIKIKNKEENKLAEWLMLLSGKGELVKMALSKNAEKIKKAYEELEYLSQNKAAREEYDAYQRAIIDEKMKIQYAEEKGISIEEKRGEKNKTIEIAKEMLKLKMPMETIIQITKLSEEELNKIDNKINK